MKLSDNTVKLIVEATNLSCVLGVEGIIIDNEAIRGYNDDEGVIVMAVDDFDFEFESLGLARLSALKSKFGLLKDLDSVSVEAVPRKNKPELIEKLAFDCGKVNFEFRCALPKGIKDVPSLKLNKKPVFYFDITEEDVATMTQGSSAMRSKNMTIQGKGNDVQFRFSDDTGDILNCKIDSDLTNVGDAESLTLTVNLKKMLPIFKLAVQPGKFRLNILKNNIVYVTVNNMDVLVMPEV